MKSHQAWVLISIIFDEFLFNGLCKPRMPHVSSMLWVIDEERGRDLLPDERFDGISGTVEEERNAQSCLIK